MPGLAWPRPPKIISSICSFSIYVNACKNINFITPIVEILQLKNPVIWLAKSIFPFNHAHLQLYDQFVALIDLKLQAKNQLYTSISFWKIKVLKASFWGALGHYPQNEIFFPKKSGSISFLPLRDPNLTRSFTKILWTVLKKTRLLLTNWHTDCGDIRIPFCS